MRATTPQNRLIDRLKQLGAVRYDLLLPETKELRNILEPDEELVGVVFGRYRWAQLNETAIGRGVLLATDRRVLLLDKKPLFTRLDEILYPVISGVNYAHIGFAGTLTLESRVGNINMRTFNDGSARHFVTAIETRLFAPELAIDDRL